MTIIFIMLVQALPVYIIAVIFKNRIFITLTAVFMSLLAIATGSPAFILVDLFGIWVAYWIGISLIKKPTVAPQAVPGMTSFESASSRKALSDLLNFPDSEFIASLEKFFAEINDNALIMTLVAYANQEVTLKVIEEEKHGNDQMPKSLDELIRITDPIVNDHPDEIAYARRHWFTLAGLLLRAERMASQRADATEFCTTIWIRMVAASRLLWPILSKNQLWSVEEKEMLTHGIPLSPADSMMHVYNMRVPQFVKSDERMNKIYAVTIRGMSEEKWNEWQAEKKAT